MPIISHFSRQPLLLHLALLCLAIYSVLDVVLGFSDSRSNTQNMIMLLMVLTAVCFSWRGNHFGYLFCVVLSAFLLLAPTIARLNAPDRLLIPYDIPMSIALLLAFLSPPVRRYFGEQRARWYQQHAKSLSGLSGLQPLFPVADANNATERNLNALFWRDDEGRLLFFAGQPLQAHRIPSLDTALSLKQSWSALQKRNVQMMLLGYLCGAVVLVMFNLLGKGLILATWPPTAKWFVAGCVAGFGLLGLVIGMRRLQQSEQKQLADFQLEPMSEFRVSLLKLMEHYGKHDPKRAAEVKKIALVFSLGLLVFAVLFSVLISPKIMEERRQQQQTDYVVKD